MTIPANLVQYFRTRRSNVIPFVYQPPRALSLSTSCQCTLCFIPGFRSKFMESQKSHYVYQLAKQHELGFFSWDHSDDGSVQQWFEDGCEVLQRAAGPLLLVGASMGTWLALLIASKSALRSQVTGIIGIGAGVDFTERWLTQEVPLIHQQDINYEWRRPSNYASNGYYPISIRFLLESRPALILPEKHLMLNCPVHLIHGCNDNDVPLTHVEHLKDHLTTMSSAPIRLDVISDGDHRLSRPQDLLYISQQILQLFGEHRERKSQ